MILAKTVKGYGLGEAGEGRKTAHQQKKLSEPDLMKIRDRFSFRFPTRAAQHIDSSTGRRKIRRR